MVLLDYTGTSVLVYEYREGPECELVLYRAQLTKNVPGIDYASAIATEDRP